jgi:hypothetical protein
MRQFSLVFLALAAAFAGTAFGQDATKAPAPASQVSGQSAPCANCGEERWDVKTLSDPAAAQVDFTPQSTTVKALYTMTAPTSGAARHPAELQTFTVHAKLVGYKIEFDAEKQTGDHDFHIVLQDMNGPETIIVEIPDPQCSGTCTSIKSDAIANARTEFANGVAAPPEAAFRALKNPVEVDVTGVLFFDFAHGQTGLAINCAELHPVLDFKFSSNPTADANPANEPKGHPKSFYKCLPETKGKSN